jgi:hypothetical protein
MTSLVVDGEAVREFLDQAEPLLDAEALSDLSAGLERRTLAMRESSLPWPLRWQLAPVARRVPAEMRAAWEPRLEPLWDLAIEGRADALLEALEAFVDEAPWTLDWATYWLHVRHPAAWPWWARWVYRGSSETGALLLVTGNSLGFGGQSLPDTYGGLTTSVRFLGSVLDLTHRLERVSDPYRPMVALAAVYGIYMLTMAAWKLTDEFTKVFPPFPVVVKTLLGVTRWEAMKVGG